MAQYRDQPLLWHITISHYSEKVRWALEYKSVAHERRTAPPGMHIAVAFWLSGGRAFTFPVLELEGRRIADSTSIIAALEQRFPEPPLYPPNPDERRRALELEDFFDEQLGPYARRLPFHEARRNSELLKPDRRPGRAEAARAPGASPRPLHTRIPSPALRGGQLAGR